MSAVSTYKPSSAITPMGNLYYGFLRANHQKNLEIDATKPPKMGYCVSLVFAKDSPEHKAVKEIVDKEWRKFLELNPKVTGAPASSPIKEMFDKHPTEKDEYNAPIKVPTGKMYIQAKTVAVVAGKNGRPDMAKKVKILAPNGEDVTEKYANAPYTIGNGSVGRLYVTVMAGKHVSGNSYVSFFLDAVQLKSLEKYTGSQLDVQEIEGADDSDMFGDDDIAPLDTTQVEI